MYCYKWERECHTGKIRKKCVSPELPWAGGEGLRDLISEHCPEKELQWKSLFSLKKQAKKIFLKAWLQGPDFDPYFSWNAFRKRINKMCFNLKPLACPWQGAICTQTSGEIVWWEPAPPSAAPEWESKRNGGKGNKMIPKDA